MTTATLIPLIVAKLETFSNIEQKQVLAFVESLKPSTPQGVPGNSLLRFAGTISVDDLRIMQEVIEAGCEQVKW